MAPVSKVCNDCGKFRSHLWFATDIDGAECSQAADAVRQSHPALHRVVGHTLIAIALDTALWLFLYLRPNPFGKPFTLDTSHYAFHAVYYGAWAQALVACPFLLWAWLRREAGFMTYQLQLMVITLLMIVGVVDRECQRFMGMHATLPWLQTYGSMSHTPNVVVSTLASDRGGAWSSFAGLALCLVYPVVAWRASSRMRLIWLGRREGWAVAFVLVVLPTVLWNFVPGGMLRQAKVRPALLTVLREARRPELVQPKPGELQHAIATYQAQQKTLDRRGLWTFPDPEYPLLKRHVGPSVAPALRPVRRLFVQPAVLGVRVRLDDPVLDPAR